MQEFFQRGLGRHISDVERETQEFISQDEFNRSAWGKFKQLLQEMAEKKELTPDDFVFFDNVSPDNGCVDFTEAFSNFQLSISSGTASFSFHEYKSQDKGDPKVYAVTLSDNSELSGWPIDSAYFVNFFFWSQK